MVGGAAAPAADARRAAAWAALEGVPDPEVPVVSVVELGIVRDVAVDDGDVATVTVTPTYSGCPAMREIEVEIVRALRAAGFADARVRTTFGPPWTTDWITPAAREKLRGYGIAPPGPAEGPDLVPLRRAPRRAECPYCGSADTRLQSEFGSTACKAIHVCDACRQPFEEFKAI